MSLHKNLINSGYKDDQIKYALNAISSDVSDETIVKDLHLIFQLSEPSSYRLINLLKNNKEAITKDYNKKLKKQELNKKVSHISFIIRVFSLSFLVLIIFLLGDRYDSLLKLGLFCILIILTIYFYYTKKS
jgi:hypothetical protein